MRKINLKITGIHCKSCKELIENEISLLAGIKETDVNPKTNIAKVVYDEKNISKHEIIKNIEKLNYEVEIMTSLKKEKRSNKKITISSPKKLISNKLTFPFIGLGLIALFYFLVSHFGIFELMGRLNEPNISYPLIFVIGILASFHCIGMCGGIVMAYSSRYSLPSDKTSVCTTEKKLVLMPHVYYNLGRVLSYTLTGVILGGIGSFFGINRTFTAVITLLAGLFMIAVGLSLITRLSILDRITSILPTSFARLFSNQIHAAKPKGPLVIGFLNGFMPCGPLQALQIYALTSGSAIAGGLSMAAFGLGTAPLMLGFGNIISMFSQSRLKQVMQISGVIVILLGLMTINRGFINFGDNNNQKNDGTAINISTISDKPEKSENNPKNNDYQTAKMDLTYQGYLPSTLTVKKGIPVKWVIDAKQISGCTSKILLPAFNIDRNLKGGENIIEFTPTVAGTYKFSCGMQMVWGKFIVTD